jgi:flagellar biosynthetic protein FlhB
VSSEKTERPTERRIKDARKKGQIARSRDVESAAQLIAVLGVLAWTGRGYVERLGAAMRQGLERMGQMPQRTVEPGELLGFVMQGASTLAITVGPIALAAACASVFAATVQGGWNFAPEKLQPKFENLSPVKGVKKLAFQRAGFDLVKMLVAVTALTWISTRIVLATMEGAVGFGRAAPIHSAIAGWALIERLARQAAIVFALVAGADYLLQRWRLQKSLRMTKQEVKEDSRLTDGNPEVKAHLRRLQHEMVRRRMMSAVPQATVVITNPTHFAVALQYDRQRFAAPVVVAKGQDLLAARIREIARQHGVPIVENVPLAQALYRGAEIGQAIPGDLFGAVAEVLAYLIRLEQLAL